MKMTSAGPKFPIPKSRRKIVKWYSEASHEARKNTVHLHGQNSNSTW